MTFVKKSSKLCLIHQGENVSTVRKKFVLSLQVVSLLGKVNTA